MNKLLYYYSPILAIICYSISDVLHLNNLVIIGFLLLLPYVIKYIIMGELLELKYFLVIVFVASLLNLLTTDNGIGGTVIFVGSCGITAFCINRLKNIQLPIVILLLYILWFLYSQIFIQNIRVDDIFESYGLSKNYPGCLLVMLCCFWGFVKYIYYKELPLLLPIASMIMAYFLDGRASLICLVAMVLFCLSYRKKRYIMLSTILVALFLLACWDYIVFYYDSTSVNSKGMETERIEIWNSYFENLDLPTFLFGLETRNLPFLKFYSGNPHNSLLNFHYRMGIIGVIAIVYYLFKSWKVLLERKQFVLWVFVLILWIRMSTDTCLVSALDFIPLTMIFYPISMMRETYIIQKNMVSRNNSLIDKIKFELISIL